jgi:hypothetical protein
MDFVYQTENEEYNVSLRKYGSLSLFFYLQIVGIESKCLFNQVYRSQVIRN